VMPQALLSRPRRRCRVGEKAADGTTGTLGAWDVADVAEACATGGMKAKSAKQAMRMAKAKDWTGLTMTQR
jgi:hypothetical protein